MTLRILHTSDWHLGATLESASRDEEHRRCLDHLLGLCDERQTDLLLLAGDVFHYAQPSAEAQSLYYRFLARASAQGFPRQVVVVGGNHDSASRLDAPSELLGALSVDVVGGLTSRADGLDRCLQVIRDSAGEPVAVVAAVPFVHEFRLGIRTTGASAEEVLARFRSELGGLYGDLSDRAEAEYPELPRIATGHLTVGSAQDDDYDTPIHQIGSIGALPADLFGQGYDYVALGHLHRMHPVKGARAWYSGSPVPLSLSEAASGRFAIEVTIEPGQAPEVSPIPLPVERQIALVQGPYDEVVERLRSWPLDGDLAPYLYVDFAVDRYQPGLTEALQEALRAGGRGQRPRIVRVTQTATGPDSSIDRTGLADRMFDRSLRDLDPEEVFVRLHEVRRGTAPSDDLLAAFRSLRSQSAEENEA